MSRANAKPRHPHNPKLGLAPVVYQALRRVGGIAGLTRLEHDLLGLLLSWRVGRDGWSYGRRDDAARRLNVSERSVTRALAGLAAKGAIVLARWKFGVCIRVSEAVSITGSWVMAALVEAKRHRQQLRKARPAIWEVAQKLWQKCQCGQDGRTIYGPPSRKKESGGDSPRMPVDVALSPLDRAIAEGKRMRGIA